MKHIWRYPLLQVMFFMPILMGITSFTILCSPTRASDGYERHDLSIDIAHVAKQLIAQGKVELGWLGLGIQDLPPDLARSLGRKKPVGALISDVVKGGPAVRAGIQKGDVVTVYRDQEVLSAEHLQCEVAGTTAGERVPLTVVRNKNRERFSVVIGNPEETIRDPAFFIRNRLGVDVRPATSREADQYGLDSWQGVVIIGVYPGSPLT